MENKLFGYSIAVMTTLAILGCDVAFGQATGGMAGTVQGAGKPIAGATVTLFAAGVRRRVKCRLIDVPTIHSTSVMS